MFKQLKALVPRKTRVEYETETLKYVSEGTYKPDFIITLPSGHKIYIEAKGNGPQFDASIRRKLVEVRDQNPHIDLRLLFYRDGKVMGSQRRKDGSFFKQSEWAIRNGFDFAIGEVPDIWFKEI